MKKLLFITLVFLSNFIFSQSPNLINYQGLARDAMGVPVTSLSTIGLQFIITNGANIVEHIENQPSVPINNLGLFFTKIGLSPAISNTITWQNGPYNLEVSINLGAGLVALGKQQLVSVPYALYAEKSGSSVSQSLTINGNSLSITGGNTVNIPSGGTYTGGTNVNVTGTFPNFTIDATPTLALSGAQLSISGGNSVTLPTGTTYTNGNGISLVSGTIITNTAPNQTVNVTGPNVLGAYPNYTITGSANTTVTSGNSNITVSGVTPNYTISSTPSLAINGNSISISNGNTIMLPPPLNPTITGSGIAVVSPTTGNVFNVTVQTPTFTSAGAASITGVYPNYTLITASMTPGWSILGNAGTNTFTNFIGTTDGSDLSFRVNNQKAGRIENASQSVYLGYLSGPNTNTATANTGIGFNALNANTSGNGNTGVGYLALQVNNTGIWNTAIGGAAQWGNTSGSSNVALGYQALKNNSIGSGNVAIGRDAMGQNTDATGNNVAIGAFAMNSSTVGTGNVILGSNAGFQNISGSYNTATGYQSLFSNTTSSLTANGYQSLFANTTGAENTATGFKSMFANTTGDRNSAFGALALDANSIGSRNSAFGYLSLSANTVGNQNSAFGSSALRDNTNGVNNSAFGIQALMFNNTGTGNSAFGGEALTSYIGNNSTAMGWHALFNSTSGAANTVLGAETGLNNITGTGNVFLGFRAGYNEAGSNKLYIANSNVNPPLIYGDFGNGFLGLGTISPTERIHIMGAANSFQRIKVESTGTQGSSELILQTDGSPLNSLQIFKGGSATAGSTAGIPLANLTHIGSGVSSGGMLLQVISNNPMYFATNNTERMRITPNGNVGIGGTNPNTNSRLMLNNGHLQTKQTTAPTLTFSSGYTGVITLTPGSTDVAGKINLNTTNAPCAGCAIMLLTFDTPYANTPVIVITPASLYGAVEFSTKAFYVNPSLTGFTIHSNGFPIVGQNITFTYFVIEAN